MDYVYICREGDNEELRYSIRSVVKNLPEGNIWLIGGKPEWYIGNFIEVKNIGNKFENITQCYYKIINDDRISNNFILMNDDFFAIKKIENIKNYYDGLLEDKIKKHMEINGISSYTFALKTAKKILLKNKIKQIFNYEIHMPMIFDKQKLKKIKDLSLAPRSLYGNLFNIGEESIKDIKIYDKKSDFINFNTDFVSTTDKSFNLIKDKLEILFPNKTKYEG